MSDTELIYCKSCHDFHEYQGVAKIDTCILDKKIILSAQQIKEAIGEINEKHLRSFNKVSKERASYHQRQDKSFL
jgi:hypothetical protein